MYVNAGNGELIRTNRVIGIFDLETASLGKATRDWLAAAEKAGKTRFQGTEIPLSVILTDEHPYKRAKNAQETLLILSQLTPKKLAKRSELSLQQLAGEQL